MVTDMSHRKYSINLPLQELHWSANYIIYYSRRKPHLRKAYEYLLAMLPVPFTVCILLAVGCISLVRVRFRISRWQ